MLRAASALGLALCACGSPCGPSSGKVTNVVDGDTFDLESGVRVRMLLVDTPETNTKPPQCYGLAAKDATIAALEGKVVGLSYDPTQCKDMFDRTLAFVTVDGKDYNLSMVKEGLACSRYVAGSKDRVQEFDDAETVAKTDRKGIWGTCTGTVECDTK